MDVTDLTVDRAAQVAAASLPFFDDVRAKIAFEPLRLELGTWPTQMPFLGGFGAHVPAEIWRGARLFYWFSGSTLRVGFRVYRTRSGEPASYVIGEAADVHRAAAGALRAAMYVDVLIFEDGVPVDRMTEDHVQNFMATWTPEPP